MALTQISTQGIKDGTITGTDLATNVDLVDNQKIRFGTGNDLQIFHDSNGNNKITTSAALTIQTISGSEPIIDMAPNGAVELYFDGSKKFETTSAGVKITGTGTNTVEINGNGGHELYSYHDSAGVGWATGTGEGGNYGELIYLAESGSQIQFYTSGSLRQTVSSTGISVTGNIAVSGTVDGVDVAALNTTVSGKLSNIVEDTSPQLGASLVTNNHNVKFGDSTGTATNRARFGASSDLQIYHNGSNSFITNATGNLNIGSNNEVRIKGGNDVAESMAIFKDNGAVELYYDNSKKFETTSAGITVTGSVTSGSTGFITTGNFATNADAAEFRCGANADFKISHNGTENILRGDFPTVFRNNANNETLAKLTPNGAVELYYDNSKKLETFASGAKWTGQFQGPVAGDSIQWTGSSNNAFLLAMSDGNDLPANSSTGFNFHHWNGSVWKRTHHFGRDQLYMPDNVKLLLGTSNDLQIYHDGSNSYIQNLTGGLRVYNHVLDVRNDTGNETILKGSANGSVELYHNNSKKLETTSYGAVATGTFQATGNIELFDNGKLNVGTGADLQIYHSGTQSFILNNTGNLILSNMDPDADNDIILRARQNESSLICKNDGGVELYFDNVKKFETTADGVNLVGNVLAFQGQSNRLIKFRPGDNDVIYEMDAGDFYRQNIGSSRHEFFAGNVFKLGINTSGLLFPNTGTLSQNAMYFETGASTNDYSTMFGVTNYPDASGYGDQNDGYWAKIKSKGGCVVIINSDGGRNDGRNNFDHFSVYHKEGESTNGKRAFSVDHVGGIQCGQAGINIDREWGNQPSFSMTRDCNDGTNNTDDNAYFRFHGTSKTHSTWTGGGHGSDFSANMLLDGGNYNASDRRAKTDIVDCPYGLAEVLKLRPRKYQLVNSQLEPQGEDNINLGFIAQELMEILPEPVNYLKNEDVPNEKGFCRAYILDMNEVVPVLTKAIQELAAKVAVLESKI